VLFDAVQYLIDEGIAVFILSGSSARKLKRKGVNLLPGRIRLLRLDPLSWGELGLKKESFIQALSMEGAVKSPLYSFENSLVFGSLPGVVTVGGDEGRRELLRSYAYLYLEEEIRAEALSRKIGAFSRFLELAAQESGTAPNFSKISMESGVSAPAIREFYHILEDTLIVERVDPFLKSARKRILTSPRYYFFDLGVRNVLARVPLDENLVNAQKGMLFEHLVMLELIRRIRLLGKDYRVCFWRTSQGAEVDCVIDMGTSVIPIEIKWRSKIGPADIRGLSTFLREYSELATTGYVITNGTSPEKVTDNIYAVPWFHV
jgi:predicted AAA+ superfamily ATPase